MGTNTAYLEEIFRRAVELHQAGEFPGAEELYLEILRDQPAHPDANHNLGLMAMQLGKPDLGLPYLQIAWEADPSVAQYWLSLTECLLAMGYNRDALSLIEEAIERGVQSAQAQELLARAQEGDSKGEPTDGVVQELSGLLDASCYAELEGRLKPLVELYPGWAAGWRLLGVALHRQGKGGESLLRRAVELAPDSAAAQNYLGEALRDSGRLDEAAACFREALKINAKFVDAHANLAAVFQSQGRLDDAVASYKRALAIRQDANIHNRLGRVLLDCGKSGEALIHLNRAIKIDPGLADAHNNLGLLLQKQGRLDEALASVQRALEINPCFADAHCNKGVFLQFQGKYDAARASLCHALEIEPGNADRQLALGLLQQVQGDFSGALASFSQAIQIQPDSAQASKAMGEALFSLGMHDAALANIKRALELKPDYPEAYLLWGNILEKQDQLNEALEKYRRALEIQPDLSAALNNTALILLKQGRMVEAREYFERALRLKPYDALCFSNFLFALGHDETVDARTLFVEHCHFGERFEASLRSVWPKPFNSRDPERCLHIGFVSADFCHHAVANFIEPILVYLARYPQLTLHAYYNRVIEDNVTQRLYGYFKHWHSIAHVADDVLAEKIRADGIDILIDLSGHTSGNRLLTFARKPAPVQVSWIGYPGTTGLKAMDYFIADRFQLPVGQFDWQFTEKIAYLPVNSPFLPFEEAPPVSELPAINNGYMTFGSFNRLSKLSRAVIALWAQLLRALPNSKMVLGGMPQDDSRDVLLEWFVQEDIARERLSFYPKTSMSDYLALHQQVDVCLNTFPYNGGTTLCHAMWMGVPTLTLTGKTIPGQGGASILGHVDLDAFVARDAADFVQKGVYWSNNLPELASLRGELRGRVEQSMLGRPSMAAEGVERALRYMWRRWCAGLPAESFEVDLKS